MQLDDEVCLCFHVTKRKLQNFLRIERPRRAAQMSDCFGAGTGCGWCRRYLAKMFDAAQAGSTVAEAAGLDDPDSTDYAQNRSAYIKAGGGTPPPGATPA
ncbi:MAG: (2Fe-2S)-binding protein [Planctomycetia bacterium]|nr:(2Fe-2S)-binding protein [Planctomycetia bacterium]